MLDKQFREIHAADIIRDAVASGDMSSFKLTYATMFDPPEEMHTRYEAAVAEHKATLGKEFSMFINGADRKSAEKFEKHSPADTRMLLGVFQSGTPSDTADALAAAKAAAPNWARTPWQERLRLVRAAIKLIEERVYHLAAALSLEVGKNRFEALGDAQEAADLAAYAADQLEANNGYVVKMGEDPLVGYQATNYSILKPYGVWVIISPFNFPCALTGGPMGAALLAGNTVVIKPASETPWAVRLLVECFRDAGLPEGVVNLVTGSNENVGQTLLDSDLVDGITFTGSYATGMKIYRQFANYKHPRPMVLELGGKNATIVSRNADLDRAALGLMRSSFGLQGQKCSATSRIFVEAAVYDTLMQKYLDLTNKITVGDPILRNTYMGPVATPKAYNNYKNWTEELSQAGRFLTGGSVLVNGAYANGYFCAPTVVADAPLSHRLWKNEMFLPITMVHKVNSLDEAMHIANDVDFGLTSGFYGAEDEAQWFFDNIEAGVNYANRPQGSSTGAWPNYQPFGGWKGSGSSGKNAGGLYYLPLYMREKITCVIK